MSFFADETLTLVPGATATPTKSKFNPTGGPPATAAVACLKTATPLQFRFNEAPSGDSFYPLAQNQLQEITGFDNIAGTVFLNPSVSDNATIFISYAS